MEQVYRSLSKMNKIITYVTKEQPKNRRMFLLRKKRLT
jgi:hypothetical protein